MKEVDINKVQLGDTFKNKERKNAFKELSVGNFYKEDRLKDIKIKNSYLDLERDD